jgi:L-galactose dehydrogenase
MTVASDVHAMQYRPLGLTGLRVSLIGFGASPLGDVFGVTDPREGKQAVHLAIDNGINFFDVSPYYGLTLAETRLGEALVGKRDQIILATKCGRYDADEFDFSAKRIFASVEESLKRLKTDYIDLYQAHDVEFGDIDQVINEAFPAMRKLQEQGKVRFIGVTGYPPKTLMQVAKAVPVDTILSYCRYNLLINDMDTELTPFAKNGIGLINASGLHMGILTEGEPPDWHPAPAPVREAGRRLAAVCRDHGCNISSVALRYCFDHPYVSSTLVGMSKPAHVTRNLELMRLKTDPALLAELRQVTGPIFNHVWRSGRPENHG